MQYLTDGAAIYCSLSNVKTAHKHISHNLIRNVEENTGFARDYNVLMSRAIYLDAYSRSWLIENNFIDNTDQAFFNQNDGRRHFWRNNVVSNIRDDYGYIGYGALINYDGGTGMDSVRMTKNAFVLGPTNTAGGMRLNNETFSANANVIDSNYYHSPFQTGSNIWTSLNRSTWASSFRDLTWIRANTPWEDHGAFYRYWSFSDVSGIDDDDFVQHFMNFSSTAHSFSLGNCTFRDLNGVTRSGSISVPAYSGVVLMYVSGTLNTVENRVYKQ
jgi:hypothetical protein